MNKSPIILWDFFSIIYWSVIKMKVVAFNGSPRKGGNCEQALNFMGEVFNNNGIDLKLYKLVINDKRMFSLLSLFTDWQ